MIKNACCVSNLLTGLTPRVALQIDFGNFKQIQGQFKKVGVFDSVIMRTYNGVIGEDFSGQYLYTPDLKPQKDLYLEQYTDCHYDWWKNEQQIWFHQFEARNDKRFQDHTQGFNSMFEFDRDRPRDNGKANLVLHCFDFVGKHENLLRCAEDHHLIKKVCVKRPSSSIRCDICNDVVEDAEPYYTCGQMDPCDFDLCKNCTNFTTTQV